MFVVESSFLLDYAWCVGVQSVTTDNCWQFSQIQENNLYQVRPLLRTSAGNRDRFNGMRWRRGKWIESWAPSMEDCVRHLCCIYFKIMSSVSVRRRGLVAVALSLVPRPHAWFQVVNGFLVFKCDPEDFLVHTRAPDIEKGFYSWLWK